jgi:hypothetical protein
VSGSGDAGSAGALDPAGPGHIAEDASIGRDKRADSVSEDDLIRAASKPVPHADYVRTRGGRMVHRKGCQKLKHATRAVPWTWAEGHDLMWVEACLEWNGVGGIGFCRTCCPEVHS